MQKLYTRSRIQTEPGGILTMKEMPEQDKHERFRRADADVARELGGSHVQSQEEGKFPKRGIGSDYCINSLTGFSASDLSPCSLAHCDI